MAVKAGVTAALLFWIAVSVPLNEAAEAMAGADPALLVIGIPLAVLVHYIAAHQIRVLTAQQGIALSVTQLFRINPSTHFYSVILPGGPVGERRRSLVQIGDARLELPAAVASDGIPSAEALRPSGEH